ncbi:unnamed protein product [Orchesella dallaii]|uniref:SHSP domain-containing protein n=1 Tax=Orchesella dallaii TaxID=48710 RepID=A0ABP1R9Q1_9HEXA
MSVPVRRQLRDPYWFDDYLMDHQPPPRRALDQDFGTELEPDQFEQDEFLLPPPPSWFRQAMLSHFNNRSSTFNNRRLRRTRSTSGASSEVYCGRGKMQVTLDVTHFAPEDLNVKLADNYLVIEGKHEEKQEGHGFISRHFVRRYEVPASSPDFEIKPEDVNCTLNSSGILIVEIQLEPPMEEMKGSEKVIPINMSSTSSSSSSKHYKHGHSVRVRATEDSTVAETVDDGNEG